MRRAPVIESKLVGGEYTPLAYTNLVDPGTGATLDKPAHFESKGKTQPTDITPTTSSSQWVSVSTIPTAAVQVKIRYSADLSAEKSKGSAAVVSDWFPHLAGRWRATTYNPNPPEDD